MPKHNIYERPEGENWKPRIIQDYNQSKGGVDVLDRLKINYDLTRSCFRWPLRLFFTIINIAGINAQIINRHNTNSNLSRSQFLKAVAKSLAYDHARRRATMKELPSRTLREAIDAAFPKRHENDGEFEAKPRNPNRCYLDSWSEYRASKTRCIICDKVICTFHRKDYCLQHAPEPQD